MKYWKFFLKIFMLFFIGSIFGCVLETILTLFKAGHFEIRQGLIYGPFIPIYGIGTIFFYFILLYTKEPWKVFVISFFMGGFLEFMCSLIQEKVFGSVSWDYSDAFLNIGGRTSLSYCIAWGLIGLLFLKLFPLTEKLDLLVDDKKWRIVIYIVMALVFLDIIISILATLRQYSRYNNIAANNRFEAFLDRHYTDEYLDKIYNNKMWRGSE